MKRLGCVLLFLLLFASFAFARPREWKTATVLKLVSGGAETDAVVVPLPGGGAVGQSTTTSGKHTRGVYWLKTDKYTYIIPNYAKANLLGIQWWLYLTVGGQTKISIDSARTLHVIDDEGKVRAVHIIERIANEPQKAPLAQANPKHYDFAASPSDVQTVAGFLDVCGLPENQMPPKNVEAMKNAPATDTVKIRKKAMTAKVTDEVLCVGYVSGLYEGWKEGHDHGVLVANLHAAVPLDPSPVLKSMPTKEITAIDTEMKTDIPCVPDHVTFGDLKDAVVKYFRDELKKTPFLGLVPTSRLFPYALLNAFPCRVAQAAGPGATEPKH